MTCGHPHPRHPYLVLPHGAAALAPLLRAGLSPGAPVLGVVETLTKRGCRDPYVTVHLDPQCPRIGTRDHKVRVEIAVLAEEMLADVNDGDPHLLGCDCQPLHLPYETWLEERCELAALLAVLNYAGREREHDDEVDPAVVGVLHAVALDFAYAYTTAGGRVDGDAFVEDMTREALTALTDLVDELRARVDVDALAQTLDRQAGRTSGETKVRYLVRLPEMEFDCEDDFAAVFGPRLYSLLGAYGTLPRRDVATVSRQVAMHAPDTAADWLQGLGTHLGPAPAGETHLEDVLDFHTEVEAMMRTLRERDGARPHQEMLTLSVGILTGTAA